MMKLRGIVTIAAVFCSFCSSVLSKLLI